MAYFFDKMHIQDKMRMASFGSWAAFKLERKYGEQWGYYSSQSGCSPILISTVVTRVDASDYTKTLSQYEFTVERHQESLFFELIDRDGFECISSKTTHTTHPFDVDNGNGGREPGEYRIPKCVTSVYKKKSK
jgi:hypothetical protein